MGVAFGLYIIFFVFVVVYLFFIFCLFFFFSSRRRHTRCLSDWSSDVCSSDLTEIRIRPSSSPRARRISAGMDACVIDGGCSISDSTPPRLSAQAKIFVLARSEERRVGKECRSRGWRHH